MKTCAECKHKTISESLPADPNYWRCSAPQGSIRYLCALTGEEKIKRVWNFCEGERSESSTGCGQSGAWFEPKDAA